MSVEHVWLSVLAALVLLALIILAAALEGSRLLRFQMPIIWTGVVLALTILAMTILFHCFDRLLAFASVFEVVILLFMRKSIKDTRKKEMEEKKIVQK